MFYIKITIANFHWGKKKKKKKQKKKKRLLVNTVSQLKDADASFAALMAYRYFRAFSFHSTHAETISGLFKFNSNNVFQTQ